MRVCFLLFRIRGVCIEIVLVLWNECSPTNYFLSFQLPGLQM